MADDAQQQEAQAEPEKLEGPLLAEVGGEYTTQERERYAMEVAPQRDEVLLAHGSGDLRLYERLLRDDQVHTAFQQRRTAVTSRPTRVDAGGDRPIDQEAADDLREQLEGIAFDRISYKMLAGLMYGYSLGELMLRAEGTRIRLDTILVRKARRFRFTIDKHIVMTTPRRQVMPDRKFWVFTCGADSDDDLHGQGLGHWLYWPVWFKRNAHRFWALWLEKLAAGVPVAKGPANMKPEDEQKLLGILRAVRNGGNLVIPKHIELTLLESLRNSGGDYNAFMDNADAAITKIILSQTMTTEDGASLSQAKVHENVKGAVTRSDSDMLSESFCRGPARWLTEWNFPGAATPIIYRDFDEAEDLEALSKRDETLTRIGYRPTPERIAEVYGDGYSPTEAPAPVPATAPGTDPAPDPVQPGSEWIDTEDNHRMRVTGVDGTRVLFVDLDSINPARQMAWQRPYFIERCAPATPARRVAKDRSLDGGSGGAP